jgi:hypothetical protein
MMAGRSIVVLLLASAASAISSQAWADPRDGLRACQALVDQATRSPQDANAAKPNEAELARCRQIIREWTLRDARMSVDEQGRPLR